jgi:hypothetical protein
VRFLDAATELRRWLLFRGDDLDFDVATFRGDAFFGLRLAHTAARSSLSTSQMIRADNLLGATNTSAEPTSFALVFRCSSPPDNRPATKNLSSEVN